MVVAALAAGHLCCVFKVNDFVQWQHGSLNTAVSCTGNLYFLCRLHLFDLFICHVISFTGNESGTKGTHDSGDVRSYYISSQKILKSTEHRIIVEGSALNNDVFAQIPGFCNLYNLKKGILDN